MNEEVITSPKIPRRFRITKIFLYIVLIAAFCKTLRGITGTVYCIVSPESSFHVTLTDSGRCYMKHGLGFDRVPLEFVNPYDLNWIVTGLLVLILSDVFYKGCLLQQDADETL